MKTKLFQRLDILVLLLLLMIAFVALLVLRPTENGTHATVYYDGEVLDRISLTGEPGERIYRLAEGEVTVRYGADGIWIAASDCPLDRCTKEGSISRAGETILCLPMRLSVVMDGEGAYDGVTG